MNNLKEVIDRRRPAVSVVMPVYNAADYLKASIGDILSQTYANFELICVDDGSSDDSPEILDSFSAADERVRVIHQKNGGGGCARNAGLDIANGEYLLFFDSDDRFEGELIEKSLEKAKDTAADIVVFGGDVFDHQTGEHKGAPWLLTSEAPVSLENPFSVINTSVWNKLYKREHLLKHHIRFQENRIVDTMCFVFLAVVYAERIETMSDLLVHYRTNNNKSVISNSDKYPLEAYSALLLIKESLDKVGEFAGKRSVFIDFAGKYIAERLHILKSGKGFGELYNTLHDYGLKKLGITEEILTRDINNKEHVDILFEILRKEASEYLFDKEQKLKQLGIIRKESYIFPLPEGSGKKRIVIYGGGNVGKDYFLQAMNRADIELAGWVDRNYEKIGFPLQSPEKMADMQFEVVVIAITGKRTADIIRSSLVSMGIPQERIFWKEPEEV